MKHAHETYDWSPRRQSLGHRSPPGLRDRRPRAVGQRELPSLFSQGATKFSDTDFDSVMFAAECALWIVMATIVLTGSWFILTTLRVS
jgi:hypothetical protein